MKPGIEISRVWAEVDLVEFQVRVSDGESSFTNHVYVGDDHLKEAVSSLQVFKDQLHGGLLDLRFGEFGPEYANGAFHARLHFPVPGQLFVTCKQESEFIAFGNREVASSATMYLTSEPALLDRFIAEMHALSAGECEEAYLEAI